MPHRLLRPGLRTSPRWNAVGHRAARLYIALLTLVDDYGRYDGRPSVLFGDCFSVWNEQNPDQAVTLDQTSEDCHLLAKTGLVAFYEVGGRPYLQILQWQERIRSRSRWPQPEKQGEFSFCQQSAAECGGILLPTSYSPLNKEGRNNNGLSDTVIVLRDRELREVGRRIKKLSARYDSCQTWSKSDSKLFAELKKRRAELKAMLGITV